VLRRLQERGGIGKLAFLRVFAGLPRAVPELQHAAHRGVELSARLFIHLAAEQQEVYYPPVHLYGLAARRIVYRLYVVYALVVVVDVIELVIFLQPRLDALCDGGELLLAFGVTHDGGERVEEVEEGGGVSRELRRRRLR